MLLEREGYEVVSRLGFEESLGACKQGGFDVFVLGHSIPPDQKHTMVQAFRQLCPAPIISLRRSMGEPVVDGANFHIDPDPEPLLELIARLMRGKDA